MSEYVPDVCVEDDWHDFMPARFKCIEDLAAVQCGKKREISRQAEHNNALSVYIFLYKVKWPVAQSTIC